MRGGLGQQVALLEQALSDTNRRMDNMFRQGKVAEVDPAKKRVRLTIGTDVDGTAQLSPWVPYSQQAGALTIHSPPTAGQNMMLMSPGGDPEQAMAIPFTFNDANASPSDSGDEVVLSYADVKLTIQAGKLRVEVAGVAFEISAAGFGFAGGSMAHNQKNIGGDHTHGGVRSGVSDTNPPYGGGPGA